MVKLNDRVSFILTELLYRQEDGTLNNDIHIVLDSIASAAETPLAHDARCHILQLIFRHKAVEWRDGEKTPEEMFKMVKESGELPKTSQPPVGEFLDLFTSLAEEGKKVIGIFVDSVLSGTYHTACMAARQVMQEIPGADIRIFDSLTAATPISALALDILKKADEGAGMDELEVFINGAIARTETCFSVNTLEYLQKGGRIGAVGALLGSLLGIRPVITLDKEGKLVVAAKCRTRSKVLNTMLEISSSHGELERICIAHEGAEKDAEYLYEEMTKRYPDVPVLMTGIGAVLATHLGPGCIGLFVRTKE